MAKRIKDKRKRTILNTGRENKEKTFIHLGLLKAFPNMKDRLHYMKSIIQDLTKPNDPKLVNGEFPELYCFTER